MRKSVYAKKIGNNRGLPFPSPVSVYSKSTIFFTSTTRSELNNINFIILCQSFSRFIDIFLGILC